MKINGVMHCDYCGEKAPLVKGVEIYPHRTDLHSLNFYLCRTCNAYVGCHKVTTDPLGRLANAELRAAKSRAHLSFDRLWKGKYFRSRTRAYNWLAAQLKIKTSQCHIGMFDVAMCRRVIELADAYLIQNSGACVK